MRVFVKLVDIEQSIGPLLQLLSAHVCVCACHKGKELLFTETTELCVNGTLLHYLVVTLNCKMTYESAKVMGVAKVPFVHQQRPCELLLNY